MFIKEYHSPPLSHTHAHCVSSILSLSHTQTWNVSVGAGINLTGLQYNKQEFPIYLPSSSFLALYNKESALRESNLVYLLSAGARGKGQNNNVCTENYYKTEASSRLVLYLRVNAINEIFLKLGLYSLTEPKNRPKPLKVAIIIIIWGGGEIFFPPLNNS